MMFLFHEISWQIIFHLIFILVIKQNLLDFKIEQYIYVKLFVSVIISYNTLFNSKIYTTYINDIQ